MSTEKRTKEKTARGRTWAEQNVKKRFTLEERTYLVELVSKFVRTVDRPEVDSVSLQKKRHAWNQIKEDFNSVKSHNPRTGKQLKKACDNHETKVKRMHLIYRYGDDNLEKSVSEDGESPVETRVESKPPRLPRDPDTEKIKTENDLGCVTRNTIPKYPAEISAEPDGEVSIRTTLREMKSSPSLSKEVPNRHSSPPAKIIPACSLTHPVSGSVRMSRRCRELNVQIECDEELLDLLKKEMQARVEIGEIEKRKAEVELKLREEELTYKRKVWDLEIKIMEKKLKG